MGNSLGQDIACHPLFQDLVCPADEEFAPRSKYNPDLFGLDISRLRTMDLFILDNTLRQTSLGQVKGHLLSDRKNIFSALRESSITDIIVATFRDPKSFDDDFVSYLNSSGNKGINYYCFAELYDRVFDGLPLEDVPLGLQKLMKYELKHVVIEMTLNDPFINWNVCTFPSMLELIGQRLNYIKKSATSQKDLGRVLFHVRDAFECWKQPNLRKKLQQMIEFLAYNDSHVFGLMVQETSGAMLPWEVAEAVGGMRMTMLQHGWHPSHLLIHVYKGFGLAETCLLAALGAGATGVWGGVCEEGAMSGHASSLAVASNLVRVGNVDVFAKYDIQKLRQSAIKITKVITGAFPPARQEMYGALAGRAIANCRPHQVVIQAPPGVFKEGKDQNNVAFREEKENDNNNHSGKSSAPVMIYKYANDAPNSDHAYVTVIPDENTLVEQLRESFGEQEWDIGVVSRMRREMISLLQSKRRCEINSSIGLFNLYEQAGGTDFIEDMVQIILHDENYDDFDNHELMLQLKDYFYSCVNGAIHSPREDNPSSSSYDDYGANGETGMEFSNPMLVKTSKDKVMSYKTFYDAFLCHWISSMAMSDYRNIVHILDHEMTGTISWSQLQLRAKWTLAEHPTDRDGWLLDEFIKELMENFVLRELSRPKPLFSEVSLPAAVVTKSPSSAKNSNDKGMSAMTKNPMKAANKRVQSTSAAPARQFKPQNSAEDELPNFSDIYQDPRKKKDQRGDRDTQRHSGGSKSVMESHVASLIAHNAAHHSSSMDAYLATSDSNDVDIDESKLSGLSEVDQTSREDLEESDKDKFEIHGKIHEIINGSKDGAPSIYPENSTSIDNQAEISFPPPSPNTVARSEDLIRKKTNFSKFSPSALFKKRSTTKIPQPDLQS